ncbi:MAG: hypothetical protein OEX10_03885 [Candidatus Bathyarchaeota archaeon]|nr:hypothetical protein [Candidatus Bathyarchaeota archaeon]
MTPIFPKIFSSSSPVSLRELYLYFTPFERQILRRMLRERRIRVLDVASLPSTEILEEIDEYIKEQIRLARWRRALAKRE